jgi:hypothetical protein
VENNTDGDDVSAEERPRPRVTRTLTFRGAEPSEVLQAAGVTIAERDLGTIVSLTWHGDVATEPTAQLWQLEMKVEAPW